MKKALQKLVEMSRDIKHSSHSKKLYFVRALSRMRNESNGAPQDAWTTLLTLSKTLNGVGGRF